MRKLRKKEFQTALKEKLVEEAKEVREAASRNVLIEELADMQEVMLSMYDAFGVRCAEVTTLARKKRKERGSFSKQLFLEDVK